MTPTTKPWADGPFKLLATPRAALNGKPETKASRNASEMALVHNVVLRGLNSIYLQAPNVKETQDILDFMTFCSCWSLVLHSHHDTEETVYFPLLEEQSTKKGVMSRNHDEHEAFLPGLLALDKFVAEVKEKVDSYDSDRLRTVIDGFAAALQSHLHNEVKGLEELAKDEGIDWDLMGKTMAAHSKKVADRACEVPFMITNSDVTYEGGIHGPRFPPFPWFVGQIFRWMYIPIHKGAWRFSCCDDYGMPRDLPFA